MSRHTCQILFRFFFDILKYFFAALYRFTIPRTRPTHLYWAAAPEINLQALSQTGPTDREIADCLWATDPKSVFSHIPIFVPLHPLLSCKETDCEIEFGGVMTKKLGGLPSTTFTRSYMLVPSLLRIWFWPSPSNSFGAMAR